MHIAITGGSGLVGRHLVPLLIQAGHRVTVLSRTNGAGRAVWIPRPDPANAEVLRGVDAVVHLAGATVAQRWTARTRRDILDSRVLGTRAVVDAMRQLGAEGPSRQGGTGRAPGRRARGRRRPTISSRGSWRRGSTRCARPTPFPGFGR